MEFEWNDAKSEACFRQRGFDFGYAIRVFLDAGRMVRPDDRLDFGEPRFQVTGRIEGRLFVVVYTPRAHRLRIISARKANQREVDRHGASTHEP